MARIRRLIQRAGKRINVYGHEAGMSTAEYEWAPSQRSRSPSCSTRSCVARLCRLRSARWSSRLCMRSRRDAGMVTAELAACLPVLCSCSAWH